MALVWLRLSLGDRLTQIVLGLFVAGFVYCISAATTITVVTPTSTTPSNPFTAMTFLDHIGDGLARFAREVS